MKFSVSLPGELAARLDEARGDVSRSLWVRRAVERALSEAKEPLRGTQADPGSVPSSEGVRSAAPAEQPRGSSEQRSARLVVSEEIAGSSPAGTVQPFRQSVPGPNVEPVRSSSQAKRDVRPVPKGKS